MYRSVAQIYVVRDDDERNCSATMSSGNRMPSAATAIVCIQCAMSAARFEIAVGCELVTQMIQTTFRVLRWMQREWCVA